MRDVDGCIKEIRSMLDEPTPKRWDNDVDLIPWLNEGLSLQCRGAQLLKMPLQFLTVANQQEYPVKCDVIDIVDVKFFPGGYLYTLKRCRQDVVQAGARIPVPIPTNYYTRPFSTMLAYQGADANIEIIRQNLKDDEDYRAIVGLQPMPSQSGNTVTVWANLPHPYLEKGSQKILVPYPFQRAACAWAAGQALDSEKFNDEARYYFEMYNEIQAKLEDYMSQQHTGEGHVEMHVENDEGWDFDWADRVVLP